MTILTCIAKKSFLAAAVMAKSAIYLAFPILFVSHASPVGASEKTAAHASIRAADAGRHIAALANDSFEGREGGSRGGRAAGTYIVGVIERLGLQPAGDAGTYYQRFGSMRNIVALLPGSDPGVAHELIVVGAHYDHVGYGNANNSYGPTGFIHNGADDNASGVAGLLEVAEAFQQLPNPPRRSIVFAFWDGEEKGLLGSYHFLRVRPARVAGMTIVFSLNLDMIGRLRGERLEIFGARTAQGLRSSLVQANRVSNLELVFDWKIAEDSDHYAFISARIPTVMLHTGLHDQYHRPSDDTHLINMSGIEPVARLTLDLITAMASAPEPVGPFRMQSRNESAVTRRQLEMRAAEQQEPVPLQPRWGVGTRSDPGEPGSPVVVRVTPSSPMAQAGVAVGDRMMAIDGRAIESQAEMLARLAEAGDSIRLEVDRKGRAFSLEARRNKPAANVQEPQ